MEEYVERVVDLTHPEANRIYNLSVEDARELILTHPEAAREIQGSFALVAREGKTVALARSRRMGNFQPVLTDGVKGKVGYRNPWPKGGRNRSESGAFDGDKAPPPQPSGSGNRQTSSTLVWGARLVRSLMNRPPTCGG